MNPPPKQTREMLENAVSFKEQCALALAYAEYEAIQQRPELSYPEELKTSLQLLYHSNADTVFSYSESPIETVLVNSLALCFLENSIPLVMVGGVSDATSYTAEIRTIIHQVRALAQWYREHGLEGIDLARHFADEVKNGNMTRKARANFMRAFTNYVWMGVDLAAAYHLLIQASFPQTKVDGKAVRADLFFWKPNDESSKIIVECDGFQYHNSKVNFVKDRKRDRLFDANGFRHLRFSGSEINNDPIGCANELSNCLFPQNRH